MYMPFDVWFWEMWGFSLHRIVLVFLGTQKLEGFVRVLGVKGDVPSKSWLQECVACHKHQSDGLKVGTPQLSCLLSAGLL